MFWPLALSPDDTVVMIVHCDDPVYYDFMAQHGRLFNGIVGVSEFLTGKLRAAYPDLRIALCTSRSA